MTLINLPNLWVFRLEVIPIRIMISGAELVCGGCACLWGPLCLICVLHWQGVVIVISGVFFGPTLGSSTHGTKHKDDGFVLSRMYTQGSTRSPCLWGLYLWPQ